MPDQASLLFVDDERQILIALRALFRTKYQVFTADNGDDALEIIRRQHIHAIISDQRMPNMLGHELLREVKNVSPGTMRILLTGYSDMNAIISSVNDGEIFRFINKPWNNNEIRTIVDNAVQIALDTKDQAADLIYEVSESEPATQHDASILIIEDSPEITTQVKRIAPPDQPICCADSIEAAIDVLVHQEVAVLITDVIVNREDTTEFIKLLKQQYPLIMTMILTRTIDSEMAIALINQGRIYRYLPKPIVDDLLYMSIKNGLHFYQVNKQKPQLLQQQKVESVPVIKNPSLKARVLDRLKTLRTRFRINV